MDSQATHELTALLQQAGNGDQTALNDFLQRVYPDLRKIAAKRLNLERLNHTLQPTALVNEAYLRLFGTQQIGWQNRAQFFALAAKHMRFILVEHARRKKNDGGHLAIALVSNEDGEMRDIPVKSEEDLIIINDLLTRLEQIDARAAQGLELRFFGGLTRQEVAEVQHIDVATVGRDWVFAKSWLYAELSAH